MNDKEYKSYEGLRIRYEMLENENIELKKKIEIIKETVKFLRETIDSQDTRWSKLKEYIESNWFLEAKTIHLFMQELESGGDIPVPDSVSKSVVRGSQEKLKTSGTLKPEEMSEDEYVMKRIQKGLLILGGESSNAKPQPKGRYDELKPDRDVNGGEVPPMKKLESENAETRKI